MPNAHTSTCEPAIARLRAFAWSAAVCLVATACSESGNTLESIGQTSGAGAQPSGASGEPMLAAGASAQAGTLAATAGESAGAAGNADSGAAVSGSGRGGAGAGADNVSVAGAAAPPTRVTPDAGAPAAGSGGADAGMIGAVCDRPAIAGSTMPAIYVIGDSTASVYEKNLHPRTGWAQVLNEYFAPGCATVRDQALSGRSSKSFYDEGSWTPVRNALRAGDFVFIQFGHNDEKTDDPQRYTEPATTFTQYLTKYLEETIAKGATPLLLTPIQRNKWSGGKLADTHGAYPAAMRQLAQQRKLGLIDMTQLTSSYFERIGQTMTTALFMNLARGESPNYPNGNEDDTHLQDKGARVVCQLAVADLVRQKIMPAALLKTAPDSP